MSSAKLYAQSAEIVRDFLTGKGSLKNLCYASHITNTKATLALVRKYYPRRSRLNSNTKEDYDHARKFKANFFLYLLYEYVMAFLYFPTGLPNPEVSSCFDEDSLHGSGSWLPCS